MINSKQGYSKEDFFNMCSQIYLGQVKRHNFLKNDNPLNIYNSLKNQSRKMFKVLKRRKNYLIY